MLIPHDKLDAQTLRRVVEEFVTRDGTETADAPAMVERVIAQLRGGRAELHFDEDEQTTTIVAKPER